MKDKPDLMAAVLCLRAMESGFVPATNGHKVYGAFLNMVASFDPAVADALHRAAHEKPFTLSGLRGEAHFTHPDGNGAAVPFIPVRRHSLYWFRITSLAPALSERLPDIMQRHRGAPVKIGNVSFLHEAHDAMTHTRAGAARYADMKAQYFTTVTPPPAWFAWNFISATTTHARHGRNLLFPSPSAIFTRLLKRWNLFAPACCRLPFEQGSDFRALVEKSLMVAASNTHTHMLDFGAGKRAGNASRVQSRIENDENLNIRRREIGFTGYVEFRPDRKADPEVLQALMLLGRFSFFAGVGYGTPKGMGQVDFIVPA